MRGYCPSRASREVTRAGAQRFTTSTPVARRQRLRRVHGRRCRQRAHDASVDDKDGCLAVRGIGHLVPHRGDGLRVGH